MADIILGDLLLSEDRHTFFSFKELILLKCVCKHFMLIIEKLALTKKIIGNKLKTSYFIENSRWIKHGIETAETNEYIYTISWYNGYLNGECLIQSCKSGEYDSRLNYIFGCLEGLQQFKFKSLYYNLIYRRGKPVEGYIMKNDNKYKFENDILKDSKNGNVMNYAVLYGTIIPFFTHKKYMDIFLDKGCDINTILII